MSTLLKSNFFAFFLNDVDKKGSTKGENMQETMINLTIVTIVGNIGLLFAWAVGGIVWQMAKAWKGN